MVKFTSHGESIQVEMRPFGAFLWLVLGVVVRVQGRTFYPKFTHVRLKTETEFDFDVVGKRISGVVRTLNPLWFRKVRFVALIDNSEVLRDTLVVKRWYLPQLAWAFVAILLILASLGAVITAIVIWKLFRG